MDAAHFINTLEARAGRARKPERFDFVVLDLAADESLLRRIYQAMGREPLDWVSLFRDTGWQGHWREGPVLVDARQAPVFQRELVASLESRPLGLLLQSDHSPEAIRTHLARWIQTAHTGEGNLVRVHEPRMIGPLLCSMEPAQHQSLLSVASRWHWHDGHFWREAGPAEYDPGQVATTAPVIATQQQEGVLPYRLAAEACGYASHYRQALGSRPKPETWVLERLLEAREAGFAWSNHLERWLRIALRQGEGFQSREPYTDVLAQDELSRNDKLAAMEGATETSHAPA